MKLFVSDNVWDEEVNCDVHNINTDEGGRGVDRRRPSLITSFPVRAVQHCLVSLPQCGQCQLQWSSFPQSFTICDQLQQPAPAHHNYVQDNPVIITSLSDTFNTSVFVLSLIIDLSDDESVRSYERVLCCCCCSAGKFQKCLSEWCEGGSCLLIFLIVSPQLYPLT